MSPDAFMSRNTPPYRTLIAPSREIRGSFVGDCLLPREAEQETLEDIQLSQLPTALPYRAHGPSSAEPSPPRSHGQHGGSEPSCLPTAKARAAAPGFVSAPDTRTQPRCALWAAARSAPTRGRPGAPRASRASHSPRGGDTAGAWTRSWSPCSPC